MPHVIVKLYPGRTEDQKAELTKRITDAVIDTLNVGTGSVSIGFEEISKEEWAEKVYIPDIIEKEPTLYKKPGYRPEGI
jgi:4-oxalocrotonate tautomerase